MDFGVPGMGISIHAPAKGATQSRPFSAAICLFQSTLPRRERLIFPLPVIFMYGISIHAPAKGATMLSLTFCVVYSHFNPRSREGSDIYAFSFTTSISDFNPRSREGSDIQIGLVADLNAISIHAPAKGATAIFHKSSS